MTTVAVLAKKRLVLVLGRVGKGYPLLLYTQVHFSSRKVPESVLIVR